MACEIERPDPQALFNRYRDMFSNIVLGGSNVIPESNEWYAVSLNYAMAEEFYALAEQALKERDPRYACCDNLIAMAELNGVYPRPAQYAQGYVRITGTPGAVLPDPVEVMVGDFMFTAASGQPTVVGEDGSVVLRVRATVPGNVGNIRTETGTLVSPTSEVDSEVEICGATFCNGADAEDCESFRTRYLNRLQYQPRATNAFILDKLLEWPCATRAIQRAGSCCQCDACDAPPGCDCSCSDCGGSLAFYVMFDNTFECGIAPEEVLEEIEDWMFGSPQGYGLGQMEVGICGRIVPVTALPINVYIDIVGCPTGGQIEDIRNQITELFGQLEPSQAIRAREFEQILLNIIGPRMDFAITFDLADPTMQDAAFITDCQIEVECDYAPCLANLFINQSAVGGASC